MLEHNDDIIQPSYTLVEAKGALSDVLVGSVANRVFDICDLPEKYEELAVTGYPFLYRLFSMLHEKDEGENVLEIGPQDLGSYFLSFLEEKGYSVRGVDNGLANLHVRRMSWTDAGNYFPGGVFNVLYHHRIGPQGEGRIGRQLFESTHKLLAAKGFYIGCKRWGSQSDDPIPVPIFTEAGYQETTLKIKSNLADQIRGIDEGYDVTIMQKPEK